jgi:histone-lysine N-methyltransferase SETMAR
MNCGNDAALLAAGEYILAQAARQDFRSQATGITGNRPPVARERTVAGSGGRTGDYDNPNRTEKADRRTRPDRLWVYSDNAWPHTAKISRDYISRNRMKQAPHPSYSPDLAPSDFFLFGYAKGKLMRYRVETPSKLLVHIRVTLAEIPRETLNAVFLEWMERLQKCVQVDG